MENIVKVIVPGTPISKSNFKLYSKNGRYILPYNSGKYYDRYGVYEQQIAYEVKRQCPNVIFDSSLTAILKVFYKYEKKHPDTINITKSIFDGIEKSGLILNDSQITKIYVEEFYDRKNPRFELTLFENHLFDFDISIRKKDSPSNRITYTKSLNSKKVLTHYVKNDQEVKDEIDLICYGCENKIINNDYVKMSKSNLVLCKKCLHKSKAT